MVFHRYGLGQRNRIIPAAFSKYSVMNSPFQLAANSRGAESPSFPALALRAGLWDPHVIDYLWLDCG